MQRYPKRRLYNFTMPACSWSRHCWVSNVHDSKPKTSLLRTNVEKISWRFFQGIRTL
jgi:hypothetical protein